MPATRVKSVAFGASRAGLTTVGYTLTGLARTATGVVEVVPGTGIYRATVTIPDGFAGLIVWDTGQAADLIRYAADELTTGFDPAATIPDVPNQDAVTRPTYDAALYAAWIDAFGKESENLAARTYKKIRPDGTAIRTFVLILDAYGNTTDRT
jgi:hypothetical protein